MANVLTNLICQALANVYLSYNSYRALSRNAANTELLNHLMTWLVVTAFLAVCDTIVDPIFALWLPLYPVLKVAFVAWMVYPGTLGANLLFVTKVDPWLSPIVDDVLKWTTTRFKLNLTSRR